MQATFYPILRPLEHLGWARPEDFECGPGTVVAADLVLTNRAWSLYTLDLETGFAWFVELPDEFDLSQSAFIFLDQHQHARNLLQVGLDDLLTLAETLAQPEKLILIFNIGRCGSTLVSHVMNSLPAVWGLSEPMVYPRLIMQNFDSTRRLDCPRAKRIALIRACTALLFRPPVDRPATTLALKFHSQVLFQADLYHEAFPQAACVFLYREALGWTRSFYQMVRNYGFPPRPSGPARLSTWNGATAAADLAEFARHVDIDAEEIALEDGFALGWAHNMQEYTRQLAAGVPFLALRYDELNTDRVGALGHLFKHCGLPTEAAQASLSVFDHDSQAGTLMSRDDATDRMTAAQVDRARSLLARHATFGNPDLILPDIYSDRSTAKRREPRQKET